MGHLAIFLANGSEDTEVFVPMDIFKRLEIPTDFISIEDGLTITTGRGIKITADKLLNETNLNDYSTFVIPGGQVRGSFESNKSAKLADFYRQNFNNTKYLFGAICAAPHILHYFGVLTDRKVTCFPSVRFEGMPDGQGGYGLDNTLESQWTGKRVEIDGNLITSVGPGSSMEFAVAISEKLVGKEKVKKILKEMQYNIV